MLKQTNHLCAHVQQDAAETLIYSRTHVRENPIRFRGFDPPATDKHLSVVQLLLKVLQDKIKRLSKNTLT